MNQGELLKKVEEKQEELQKIRTEYQEILSRAQVVQGQITVLQELLEVPTPHPLPRKRARPPRKAGKP